jgi:hypothetical protein
MPEMLWRRNLRGVDLPRKTSLLRQPKQALRPQLLLDLASMATLRPRIAKTASPKETTAPFFLCVHIFICVSKDLVSY